MKQTRQNKILELIAVQEIETQEELAERALRKVTGKNGRPKYASLDYGGVVRTEYSERYAKVLQSGMVSMEQADNLLVIKTVSGMAMAVATAVDALGIDEIVGSIAGDDTIMCAVSSAELVPGVIEQLKNLK